VTTAGAVRPALLLAKEFVKRGYDVTLVSTRVDKKITEEMRNEGISSTCVGPRSSFVKSLPTLDAWARRLIRPRHASPVDNSDFVINTSSCIVTQASAYYAQGPMTRTLRDISQNMPAHYRYSFRLLEQPLRFLEQRLVQSFSSSSKVFVANSKFCASMYRDLKTRVDAIIHPPLDCSLFQPKASKPTEDYVLTHLGVYGKEGNSSVVETIADAGADIKIFGDPSYVPRFLRRHPNIDVVGKVSDQELGELYSNALYTLFAFSHEPFGYIPVESMACGTPVLTYNRQGPAETVVNLKTGWLGDTDRQLFELALNVWKNGYSSRMRTDCRKAALAFDVSEAVRKWTAALRI
jgi:glycosyltransferase involved in cell wall biosynthesis